MTGSRTPPSTGTSSTGTSSTGTSSTGTSSTSRASTSRASTSTARVAQEQARRALDRITGLTADRALKILRFSPAEACEPVHRLVTKAVADIRRESPEVAEADLLVTGGRVTDGEAITRVRRHAHGNADWITTYTTAIEVELTLSPRPGLTLVEPAPADDADNADNESSSR
jgi:ribosomal protein L22